MKNLDRIENKIKLLKDKLHELIKKEKELTTWQVVNVSQELDAVLIEHYKIKK